MTKINKSKLMTRAWEIFRKGYCPTFARSLKQAWNEAKGYGVSAEVLARVEENNNKIPNAFKAKYPNGTLTKKTGHRGYRYDVTFTPGGKVYTYIGGIAMIAEKLGLEVA